MAFVFRAVRRRWTLIVGCALAAMVAGGLFQVLRPATYVSVAMVDIEPTLVNTYEGSLGDTLGREVSFVTAPEVVAEVEALMGSQWGHVRTVKASPFDDRLRIAVSSHDPAVATEASELIGRSYANFLNARMSAIATSQGDVISESADRQRESLVQLNDRIDALTAQRDAMGGNEVFDDADLQLLMADREVTVELLAELLERRDVLDELGSAQLVTVTPAEASAANLGFERLALFGFAVLLVVASVVVAADPHLERRAVGRRRIVHLDPEPVIDLREAERIISSTPRRPL